MPNTPFEEIWRRIVTHEGEIFRTKTGLEFTYRIDGEGFYPSRTNYRISKTDFRRAYEIVPIDGPGVINDIVEDQPTFGQFSMINEYLWENGDAGTSDSV